MSKSKYKVVEGQLAQISTTGEPVFVLAYPWEDPTGNSATIIRPVVTQDGIVHQTEQIEPRLLETRFEQAKRNVEFQAFINDLQEQEQDKKYKLSNLQLDTLHNVKKT